MSGISIQNAVQSKDAIPFSYLFQNSAAISANGSLQAQLTLQSDSWFELTELLACSSASGANTDQQPNNFSLKLTDQSTGRAFSSDRIPEALIAATARYGLNEYRKVLFPPKATIQFDILNLTSSQLDDVYVVLKGYKHFTQ